MGNLNWVFARKTAFSIAPLNALSPILKTLRLDRILLGGDFTTSSRKTEFAIAKSFVEQLPAPWLAVPGNHDRYTFSACRKKVYYQYFVNPPSEYTLQEHGVEVHPLNETWWIVTLDTARATHFYTSSGLFSKQHEAHLQTLLQKLPPDAKILLLNHYPFFGNDVPQHCLVRGEALENILKKDKRIKAYLHGHTHRNTIANLQPSGLPVVLDGGCSARLEKGTWNLLELDDTGITIDVYQWQDGWAVSRQERIAWTR